ncbi:piggyBac transposable element-derived protein 4-like [Anastrepha ludens]|uniref:piggyBac transposable element-derived protein 4-like n=1 Tax=Anastrepha ludens TaxID=28586 RepID=UPI0023B00EAF|nr:piggyBac transposable element-derived protein 4-like [Anastrepha ludens]
MSNSESEFSLAAFLDDEESCSEFEDHVEVADSSDSDFSDDENSLVPSEMMSSKNGQINFSKTPLVTSAGRASRENIISLIRGLTRYSCSRIAEKEISSFELFFPPPLIRTILTYTNIEGKLIYGEEWLDIENIELFAFIGLLILAGVFRSNNESCESLWNPETGRPIFAATMPLKTFKKVSRVIRFDNRETRREGRSLDKFAPIRDLWNQWVEILPKLYNPTENVTIDEQLVAFRGRCPFRQYIPAKPAKYGIKFWVLCDSTTSYVWNIQPYTGKAIGRTSEKNQGMRVVLDLIEGLKGLPPALVNIKRKPLNSSIFAFTEQTTLVSYIPKKNRAVILLSTLHHYSKISNRRDKKPEIILDYNKCKGGVDTLDTALSYRHDDS